MTSIRKGRQDPTFQIIGDYDYSFDDELIEFYSRFGVTFAPYQKLELKCYCARNINKDAKSFNEDFYAGSLIAIARPRQTGKSFVLKLYSMWEALNGKKVLYTCHNYDTVRQMFIDIKDMFENNSELGCKLRKNNGILSSPGNMGVFMANGGLIEFRTRTDKLSRGRSYDLLLFDECQELTEAQLESVMATIIAQERDSQSIAIGTPPSPTTQGTLFRDWYDTVHAEDADTSIWWLEWATDKIKDPSDVEAWYAVNPGLGYRITEKKLAAAASAFSKDWSGFSREYLGYWSPKGAIKAAISEEQWFSCQIDVEEAKAIDGLVSYGVKFAPDGLTGSISACIKKEDGTCYVELIEHKSMLEVGVSWFADWLVKRLDSSAGVIIDGLSHANNLMAELDKRGIKNKLIAKQCSSGDYVKACSMFFNALIEKTVSHAGFNELTETVFGSGKRYIGKNGGWGFTAVIEEVDVSILDSVALAYYQAQTSQRKPGRKMLVL